jgi:glycosyltransferase involved in cell wall biosynthesis
VIRIAHAWSHDLGIPASLPFCRPLLERGWEVTFVCPPGRHVPLAAANGMRFLPLALQRRFHPPSDFAGAWQLARYLRRERWDILHTHNNKVGHVARVLAYAAGVPIVVHTLHGLSFTRDDPWLRRRGFELLERIASLRVDAVLSQGEEDRETLVASGAVEPDRALWIGNGIDLSRFDPDAFTPAERRAARDELGLRPGDILFLSAGRMIRAKGFLELFEAAAAAHAADPRIRLAVAGEPDAGKSDSLDTAALHQARRDGVRLLGPRADMPRLYAACDVVVLATWREGMPRVLMEGAAMGKPLLATDARGCREVVRPPRNGRRVPVRAPEALAAAMVEMAADPDRRARWGRENAREARERYDVRAVVKRVVDVYDDLLDRKGLS